MQDSNLRPLAPKASAIPDYANSHCVIGPGLEPKLIESKSIVLTNYTIRQFERVTGFEPATSYLEGTHSTNWATPAFALFENYDIPAPSLTVMCSTSELKKRIYKKKPLTFQSEVSKYCSKIFTFFTNHLLPLTARNCQSKFDSVDYKVYVLEFSLLIYI